jgi:hypothetical protein
LLIEDFGFLIGKEKDGYLRRFMLLAEQCPHLCDGDVVEGGEAFGLWQALAR